MDHLSGSKDIRGDAFGVSFISAREKFFMAIYRRRSECQCPHRFTLGLGDPSILVGVITLHEGRFQVSVIRALSHSGWPLPRRI